ncbi:MAG: cobyric acid synthase [Desulfamplus sp.]|nr:cobyric acid synthase [Desulfamplus sp.]
MKKLKPIAIFGTGSDVGKSIVAAALCKSFADRGISVAPFKAQNMSNNSGITPEGSEMGRAQIVQAEAAGVVPHVDMNPVLLKPTGEKGSQVVLNGMAVENSTAMEYHKKKDFYFDQACMAFDRLRQHHGMIILEGAGSCAEVNLMATDIVNFRMAQYAGADVVLVADIHRGGVFGQIVGTLECLPRHCREMIRGIIINRFRGDIALFQDGVEWIEQKTGKKVLGVLPWYHHFRIDAEDSVELETLPSLTELDNKRPAIAVIKLKHISNFTDFHALTETRELQVIFVEQAMDLERFKAVIIPGSKNTRSDLNWLEESGWSTRIKEYATQGGHVLGICGGFQILGNFVDDPQGLEGIPGSTRGLELLPVQTILKAPKTTTLSTFSWYNGENFGESAGTEDLRGEGYEIHMGHTTRLSGPPMFKVHLRNSTPCDPEDNEDGAVSRENNVRGTYMHGMFDVTAIKNRWIEEIGILQEKTPDLREQMNLDPLQRKKRTYTMLRNHFEKYVDIGTLLFTRNINRLPGEPT